MKQSTPMTRSLLLLATSLLAFTGAEARTRPLALGETAAMARDIVVATCSGQSVNQAPGNGQLVFTTWTFKRETLVKDGGLPETFSVRVVGGTVGKLRVTVPDAPVFQRGKQYLVFLRPSQADAKRFTVCGARQGVLEARRAADGAWEVLAPSRDRVDANGVDVQKSPSGGWVSLESLNQTLQGKGGRQ